MGRRDSESGQFQGLPEAFELCVFVCVLVWCVYLCSVYVSVVCVYACLCDVCVCV
jgi:hypothetical protein